MSIKCISSTPNPSGLRYCLLYGGGDVESLFYVPPIVCGGSVFGLCFFMHYFVPFLVLPSF